MKTNVYIDAGNLYFGLLRKRPEYKWLDLVAFAETLLPARCQLPDAIPVGTHGNFITRPAAWR